MTPALALTLRPRAGRLGLRMARDRRENAPPSAREPELIAALRRGEEPAFITLMDEYGAMLMRVARMYVSTAAVAEEVVQDTWIGVLNGIDRFEGRSSLKTWIFRILTNTAKTRGEREARSIPFSSAVSPGDEASVDPDRFLPASHERSGEWALAPRRWETPEESLLSGETREAILAAIDKLPPAQREVITLRDLEGWSSQEVCNALEIQETNQRVLLHRARSKVRGAIERHLDAMEPAT
jgi:RNA polymerase sigma-70 factor, ECF subfamily